MNLRGAGLEIVTLVRTLLWQHSKKKNRKELRDERTEK
jgi:hypothetical protein